MHILRTALGHSPLVPTALATIFRQVKRVAAGALPLQLPGPTSQWKVVAGFPFHPTPKLFFQLSGETLFHFPDGKLHLAPGQAGIIPPGTPHRETVSHRSGVFCNLVFTFRKQSVCFHLAHEHPPGFPAIWKGVQVDYPHMDRMIEYLIDISESNLLNGRDHRLMVKGAYQALLAHCLIVLRRKRSSRHDQPFKILQARQYILDHCEDPALCVKQIADYVHCTPDYLSYLFHKETGMPLFIFINEQRIFRARQRLRNTTLNISEIARASGFTSAGYFTRLFHKATGMPPSRYRNERLRGARERPESPG